jgi:hypothetical protein
VVHDAEEAEGKGAEQAVGALCSTEIHNAMMDQRRQRSV